MNDEEPLDNGNTLNVKGMTELHLAAYHGEPDWVENCIKGGLSVHVRDKNGLTPLHWAAFMGLVDGERENVVAVLISAGADVNAVDNGGGTVLQLAQSAGNEDVVRQLIAAGARFKLE